LFSAKLFDVAKRPYYFEFQIGVNYFNYATYRTYFLNINNLVYLREFEGYYRGDFTYSLANRTVAGIGVGAISRDLRYYQTNSFSSTDTADRSTYKPVFAELFLRHDSRNRDYYANRGTKFDLSVRAYTGQFRNIPGNIFSDISEDISQQYYYFDISAEFVRYFKISRLLTLGIRAEGYLSTKNLLDNYTLTMLYTKQFEPTEESRSQFMTQFRADRYLAGGATLVFSIAKNTDFRLEAYTFEPLRSIETSNMFKPHYGDILGNLDFAFSGVFVYHAKIAPISIAFNYYTGETRFNNPNVVVKIGFTSFNKKQI
jgi:NTE family protein